jgi:hypothetical protein
VFRHEVEEISRVDDILRRRLIHALEDRRWASLDAERAAAAAAGLFQDGDGEWKVWRSQAGGDPSIFRVARQESAVSVFDSLVEGRARDVANALNELEPHGSDPTSAP